MRGISAALGQLGGITLGKLCQETALLGTSDAHAGCEMGSPAVGQCGVCGDHTTIVPKLQLS